MRHGRKNTAEMINTAATVIGCTASVLMFTVGAFWLGDRHPVTIAFAVVALGGMVIAVAGGMAAYGQQ